MITKFCNKCKQNKMLDSFGKDKSKKDGIRSICKQCDSIRSTAYGQTEVGKISRKNSQRKYLDSLTTEEKAERKQYQKDYEKSSKGKEVKARYNKKYRASEHGREIIYKGIKKYNKTEKGINAQKRYNKSEKGKKIRSKIDKKFRSTEKGKALHCSVQAKRRANQLSATPKWLTHDQILEINDFYKLCKELQWLSEEKLHVDHIIPLQGENVCGLHVPWNLQILPESINCSKNNKVI